MSETGVETGAFLLDTHAFVWLATDHPKLSARARSTALNENNALHLSVASVWEMAIKKSLGRFELKVPLGEFVRGQLSDLDASLVEIRLQHALIVETLPLHHRDPFDRLLIAQAIQENFSVLSADASFDAYGVKRIWT